MQPTDEAGVQEAVRETALAGQSLEIEGGGSLKGLGRPVQAAATLSLKGLKGIPLYEPSELVIRARAGTTVRTVTQTLAENSQMLPFEPPDYRELLGTTDAEPSIGGLVAAGLSGPARVARGPLRDSLIGVAFVNGDGEHQRSGGRVMKNVTGLDLVKLQAGAHGTLGVLTEVTFKILPRPERAMTLIIPDLDAARAGDAMSTAMASPLEVSAAAYLPAAITARSKVRPIAGAGSPLVFLRLENFTDFLSDRADKLTQSLLGYGAVERLDEADTTQLWTEIRDALPLAEPRDRAIWKLSTAPAAGTALYEVLKDEIDADGFLDWAGGLIWLSVAPSVPDAGHQAIRQALKTLGGHATLIRAPAALRAAIDVFEPQKAPVMALTKRIKDAIDPKRVLNPGRMYAGI